MAERRKAAHGTVSKYQAGCRCTDCTAANNAYKAVWRARQRANGFVFVKGYRRPRGSGDAA